MERIPPIDLSSHRAAIDALEAQRAAYRRFARQAEAQQAATSAGDVGAAEAFTDGAVHTVAQLHEHARSVRDLVDAASSRASDVQLREIEHRVAEMVREARNAETAIRNLSTQLEAWRDAYGRQLAEIGIVPGPQPDAAPDMPD